MHLKSKASAASLCKWPSFGAIVLVVGGAFSVCPTALAQNGPGPLATIRESWEGMSSDFTLEPPDPHGAAGPNGIIQTVNLRIKYWNKNGTGIWGPVALSRFWSSVGTKDANLLSDPRALFDRASGRFYVIMQEADRSASRSYLNVAVSKTADPVTSETADWFFYRIDNTEVVGGVRYWSDYPGLAIDRQAVYLTYNMFSFPIDTASFRNVQIIVLNKTNFNAGTTNYGFAYPPTADAFTLQPCSVQGIGSPSNVAYFAETFLIDDTHVRVWALKDPLGARTLSSTNIAVPNNGGYINGAPQPGTFIKIDTLSPRTQGNAFWDNGAIWFCNTAGGDSGKSRVYYYKVNLNNFPSGTPSLGESGFIDGGPGEWTYQPSIGANSRGDVGIVYSQSSASRYPTMFAAVHGAFAASFDKPVLVKASPGYYYGGRWGDYASVTVDPVDESFWMTHEWAKTTQPGAWSTWWAQIGVPSATPDGIMEVAFTPPNGSTLVAGSTQTIFVQATDGLAVTNAAVIATVNGTNLTFLNDGVAPDVTADDSIYSANLQVPNSTNDLTLSFLITAPEKTNSTNVVTYNVVPVPPNDYFTNAIKVPPGGALYLSNNRFATNEPGEPQHAGEATAAASLWWNWSPASTTNVFIDTTGSRVDTILAVYQGPSVTNLTQVIATNDVGARKQAYLNFNATGGASYRIAVASVNPNETGSLRLLVAPGGSFDTNAPTVFVASPLSGQWSSNFLVTVSGTANDPEPNASGVTRVQLSVNGHLPVTATGTSNWSSMFGLDRGLNHISVTAEDLAGNVSAAATIEVTYVLVNPVNDLFANAIPLSGDSGSVSATTTNATKEFNEPYHAGNAGGKSVWWSFQPSADGSLSLTTSNSTFDTLLGLYTGEKVTELTTLASNDDAYPGAPGGFSALTHALRANQTYYVAVDGFDGASGDAYLGYSFTLANLFSLSLSTAGGGQVTPSSSDVVSNSTVVLTAAPDPFFEFDSWAGSFLATANPLSLVVNSNISLTAHFHPVSFTDDFETGNLLRLGWISSGARPWLVQTNTVLAGNFSARSGAIGNNQTSSLILTTNFIGGTASFFFKVSSEPDWDFLNFYVDGVLQQRWSGEIDWTSFSLPLPGGTHTLEWRYTKDPSISAGLDAAFLDNVIMPLAVPKDSSTPAFLQMLRQSDGALYISLLGQTNQRYILQSSTNLVNWQNASTNIAVNGFLRIPLPASPYSSQFYRALVP